jgi:hypothetical protein
VAGRAEQSILEKIVLVTAKPQIRFSLAAKYYRGKPTNLTAIRFPLGPAQKVKYSQNQVDLNLGLKNLQCLLTVPVLENDVPGGANPKLEINQCAVCSKL